MSDSAQKYLAYRATGNHTLGYMLGSDWTVLKFGYEPKGPGYDYTYLTAERK